MNMKKNKKRKKVKNKTKHIKNEREKELASLKKAYARGELKFDSTKVAESILEDRNITHGLLGKFNKTKHRKN